MNAVVCQITVLEKLRMSSRAVWQIPLMYDLAVVVDKVDRPRTGEVREQCIPRRDFVRVHSTKTESATGQCALLHVVEVLRIYRRV